jgi:hypothetical protein
VPSKDSKMSKQCIAGKSEHVTLIPQKLEIMKSRESGRSQSEFVGSYNIGFGSMYNIRTQKDQV